MVQSIAVEKGGGGVLSTAPKNTLEGAGCLDQEFEWVIECRDLSTAYSWAAFDHFCKSCRYLNSVGEVGVRARVKPATN